MAIEYNNYQHQMGRLELKENTQKRMVFFLLLLLLFLIGAFSAASFYQLFSNDNHFILQGATSVICVLIGANLFQAYLTYHQSHSVARSLGVALVYSLLLWVYLGSQLYVEKIGLLSLIVCLLAALVGGIFFAFLRRIEMLTRSNKALLESQENNQTDRQFRMELSLAMDAISKFNFTSAREKLSKLSECYPNSAEVMEQRYHLEKLHPDDGIYWDCARDLVNYSVVKEDYERMKFIFADIQKNAPSKKRAKDSLAPEYYHKMMMVFVKYDDLNTAEQAFLFLELAGQKDIIKDACQLLLQEFKSKGLSVKQQQYQMLFERLV